MEPDRDTAQALFQRHRAVAICWWQVFLACLPGVMKTELLDLIFRASWSIIVWLGNWSSPSPPLPEVRAAPDSPRRNAAPTSVHQRSIAAFSASWTFFSAIRRQVCFHSDLSASVRMPTVLVHVDGLGLLLVDRLLFGAQYGRTLGVAFNCLSPCGQQALLNSRPCLNLSGASHRPHDDQLPQPPGRSRCKRRRSRCRPADPRLHATGALAALRSA